MALSPGLHATVAPTHTAALKAAQDGIIAKVERFVHDQLYKLGIPARDAEDVSQDVFLRLWAARERFDPSKGNACTFANAIIRQVIGDHLEARGKRVPAACLETPDAFAGREPDPAAVAEDADEPIGPDAGRLLAGVAAPMLGCLSAKERELVAMFAGEKLSVPEVAARLGRKVSLVEISLRAIAGKLIEAGVVPEELAEKFARWRASEKAHPARPTRSRSRWRPAGERRAEGGAATAA